MMRMQILTCLSKEIMIKYGSNGEDGGVQELPSTNTAPATLAAAESQFQ
jgi:hypothetical protein